MSDVSDTIARLKEAGTPFRIVEGAIEFAAIRTNPPLATPAAYVFKKDETSGPNERATGRMLQPLEGDMAVVIVIDNQSDVRHAAGAIDIEALKAWVRGKLVGHVLPSADEAPLEHISGTLLQANNGRVMHEDVYAVSSYLEQQS